MATLPRPASRAAAPARNLDVIWFTVYAALLVALDFIRPLALPDEGRYGEIGRQMLVTGDFVTPRLNGLPFFHKPPLLYWLDAGAMHLFGVHPWAARLAPTLHALILCGAVYAYCRRFLGLTAARFGAAMLAISLGVLGGAQYINHDLLVATWISVCILAFGGALQTEGKESRRMALAGFAASALAVLCKGMIGFALPGLVLFLWITADRRWGRLLHLPWLSGIAVFLAIASPWFILCAQRFPEFLHYFFVEQQFTRYVGAGFNNRQPVWFYVAVLPILFFPWSLLVRFGRDAVGDASREPSRRLALVWCAAILLFFSIPASKLVGYIFPAMAPLVLLAAPEAARTLAQRGRRYVLAAGSLLFAAAFGWVIAKNPAGMPPAELGVVVLAAMLWSASAVRLARAATSPRLDFGVLLVANLVGFIAIAMGTGTAAERHSAVGIAGLIHAQDPDRSRQLMVYGSYPFDLPFYLDRPDTLILFNNWAYREKHPRDNGAQQLLDGRRFDPASAAVLMEESDLPAMARKSPRALLVVPDDTCCDSPLIAGYYREIARRDGLVLMQPAVTAPTPAP